MKKILLSLFIILTYFNCFSQENNNITKIKLEHWDINNNNEIKMKGYELSLYCIYNVLDNWYKIPPPFTKDNETKLNWIDSSTWYYNSKFNLNNDNLNISNNIELVLDRVNTYAKVYINDKLIGSTYNEFIKYHFNIKPYVHSGENSIKIIIEPTINYLNYNSEEYTTLKSEKRVIARKAQYRFGWDWFPKMLSVGFNDVHLEIYNNQIPKIEFANVQTLSIDNDTATMILNIGISNLENKSYTVKLRDIKYDYSSNPDYYYRGQTPPTTEYVFSLPLNNNDSNLKYYSFKFKVDSPHIWFPNGAGKQYIYKSSLEIFSDKVRLNSQNISFGIRTIELVQEKDSIGQSFYFKVNGKPLFIKGANYIQGENLDNRSTILTAKELNFNMLRIWGGSRYSDDQFYELCDNNGMLVWQDFPFACALYPSDSNFLDNVKKEAEQNVRRITGHPSLALWCGNNEIWEGWNNWGWKQEVKDTIKAVENYNNLFKELLPDIVNKYCSTTNYIHTSPLYGWGRKESLTHGDCHYWGVWWADSTFETYTHKIPRFMSEYGFQSTPNLETTQEYMSLPYSKENPEFAIHQKHPRGFELIDNRIKEYFDSYTSDKDYIYKSQAVQQEACKIAIEAHRRAKPYCMGTLFWQLNEEYPAIGWGIIDYKYGYKSAYYVIKKAYEPIILSIDNFSNKDTAYIYYCNDIDSNYSMNFKATIYDNNGIMRYSKDIKKLDIKKNKSEKILSICLSNIKGFNPKTDYLYVEGIINNKTIDNHSFFVKPKDYIKPLNSNNIFSIKDSSFKDISKKQSFIESKEVLRNVVIGITSPGVDWLVPEGVCIIDILPNKKNNQFEYQQVESILR